MPGMAYSPLTRPGGSYAQPPISEPLLPFSMFTPARHTKPFKFKVFLLNWACIFPIVVLLSAVLRWALARFALPEWTFTAILTGLLTFSMVYFIGPWLDRTFGEWLRNP